MLFTSEALEASADWNKAQVDFSRREEPGDNLQIEVFYNPLGESAFRITGLRLSRRCLAA